jgi:polyisoprenoid-binding protein YceI
MTNQTKWVADPNHSEILFKVKHLMITNVKGEFRDFSAELTTPGNDFSKASAKVEIQARSVFTNNGDRDNHLRSADFFETDKFPQLTFTGTSFEKLDDGNFVLNGMLTIRGVSQKVKLDVEFGGMMTDPYGNEKAGFSISGKINRKDWGLNWNTALEAGGVLVSDEVRISADIQFVKQAA